MPSTGATDRADLGRLALRVAEEFDKALYGEVADATVIKDFAASLAGGGNDSLTTASAFLQNHRTVGAFSRAWQRAYHSGVATVEDLNARIREKVDEAGELLAQPVGSEAQKKEDMKRFFLSLHRELLIQQFPPRRFRRPRINEELVHG